MSVGRSFRVRLTDCGQWQIERLIETDSGAILAWETSAFYATRRQAERALHLALSRESGRLRIESGWGIARP